MAAKKDKSKSKAKATTNSAIALDDFLASDLMTRALENVLISKTALKDLADTDDGLKEQIDGLVGSLRETIGNAQEKKHLNKKAYGRAKALRRYKSNEVLARDVMDQLAYMHMLGIFDRVKSVPPLPLDGDAGETEQGDESEQEARSADVQTTHDAPATAQ